MADVQDILLDDDNEVRSLRGDFLIGDSDAQHVQHIFEATKGNFLEHPTIGVGITEYKNGNISLAELTKRARMELQKDGYAVNRVSFEGDQIFVDAKRVR